MNNSMKALRLQKRKGFSLPELLLAVVILVIALCSLLVSMLASSFLNAANRNLTTAISHAQFALEEIRNTPFYSTANFTWNEAAIQAKDLLPLSEESLCANITGNDFRNVTVTVNWKDYRSRDRIITLYTSIAQL